jgi:glucose dehydrogenase
VTPGVLRPLLLLALTGVLPGQVTYDQILHSNRAPQNWLTYSGNYAGQRYSGLTAIGYRTKAEGYGAVRALDPLTGQKKWDYKMVDYTESGILTTASDLLFAGGKEGNFFALDARDGAHWNVNLGGTVASGPVSYAVNNRQYVAVCADSAMYVFGLPE